jgi:hypothetical protein
MNIEHYWPDVPPRAFTILREIAQARQDMAETDERAGFAPDVAGGLRMVAALLCEPHAPRPQLIECAALIVRAVELVDGPLEPQPERTKLIRGR